MENLGNIRNYEKGYVEGQIDNVRNSLIQIGGIKFSGLFVYSDDKINYHFDLCIQEEIDSEVKAQIYSNNPTVEIRLYVVGNFVLY
jgi:hypothetical protein